MCQRNQLILRKKNTSLAIKIIPGNEETGLVNMVEIHDNILKQRMSPP